MGAVWAHVIMVVTPSRLRPAGVIEGLAHHLVQAFDAASAGEALGICVFLRLAGGDGAPRNARAGLPIEDRAAGKRVPLVVPSFIGGLSVQVLDQTGALQSTDASQRGLLQGRSGKRVRAWITAFQLPLFVRWGAFKAAAAGLIDLREQFWKLA